MPRIELGYKKASQKLFQNLKTINTMLDDKSLTPNELTEFYSRHVPQSSHKSPVQTYLERQYYDPKLAFYNDEAPTTSTNVELAMLAHHVAIGLCMGTIPKNLLSPPKPVQNIQPTS